MAKSVQSLINKQKQAAGLTAATASARTNERMEELSNALLPVTTRPEFVKEIETKYREARDKFLVIGRYLVRAKEVLPHGEYEEMIRRDLPFSIETAYRFKAIAEAVDAKLIGVDELPKSDSTAYQLVTLDPEELAEARRRKLVRRDVPRSAVIAFKAEVRGSTAPKKPSGRRKTSLVRRWRELRAELQALEVEMKDSGIDPESLYDESGPVLDLTPELSVD